METTISIRLTPRTVTLTTSTGRELRRMLTDSATDRVTIRALISTPDELAEFAEAEGVNSDYIEDVRGRSENLQALALCRAIRAKRMRRLTDVHTEIRTLATLREIKLEEK